MVSKKYTRKSRRLEAIATESFRRLSDASWALDLAGGDELEAPAPKAERDRLQAEFWRRAEVEAEAALNLNLRNVSARFMRGRITREQIPAACEALRQASRNR